MDEKGAPMPKPDTPTQLRIPGARGPPPPEPITERNIDKIEQETVKEVSRAIMVLESALAQWNGLDKKPQELEEDYERYQSFHDALEDWETKALRSMGKAMTFEQRLEHIREFVSICNSHHN
jgi:hypothetical protein